MADTQLSLPYKVKLSEKPCVVQYLESCDGFIVGTYDLLPTIESARDIFPDLSEQELADKYESINQRMGSLNLLRRTSRIGNTRFRLKDTLQCQHGGIFDMSILNESIYVAHANGFIALYEHGHPGFKLCESIKVTGDKSTLLTSIDTCQRPGCGPLAVVGDSKGCITIVEGNQGSTKLEKILSKCDITEYADPVWQVKFLPLYSAKVNQYIILVAAEDSNWYVYKFETRSEDSSFQLLYTNQDFEAGVTSICLLPKRDYNSEFEAVRLMFGSYDESMRMYEFKIKNDFETLDIRSLLISRIKIKGGGIWRLNCVEKRVLYIAAMYAGTHKINIESLYGTGRPFEIDFCDTRSFIDDDNKPTLHYGIDYSPKHSIACIVDYNNNCCIFVDQ